jgi:hypothetical protein
MERTQIAGINSEHLAKGKQLSNLLIIAQRHKNPLMKLRKKKTALQK